MPRPGCPSSQSALVAEAEPSVASRSPSRPVFGLGDGWRPAARASAARQVACRRSRPGHGQADIALHSRQADPPSAGPLCRGAGLVRSGQAGAAWPSCAAASRPVSWCCTTSRRSHRRRCRPVSVEALVRWGPGRTASLLMPARLPRRRRVDRPDRAAHRLGPQPRRLAQIVRLGAGSFADVSGLGEHLPPATWPSPASPTARAACLGHGPAYPRRGWCWRSPRPPCLADPETARTTLTVLDRAGVGRSPSDDLRPRGTPRLA